MPLTRLRPHPASVGAARRFVADVLLTRDFAEGCIERAVLLTSEMVTDAIVRTANDFELVIVADHPMVRVEVHDLEGPSGDEASPAASYRLRLLDALSEASGVEKGLAGERSTWFEVRS